MSNIWLFDPIVDLKAKVFSLQLFKESKVFKKLRVKFFGVQKTQVFLVHCESTSVKYSVICESGLK